MVGLGVMKGRASTPTPIGEGDWGGRQSKTSKAHPAGENEAGGGWKSMQKTWQKDF